MINVLNGHTLGIDDEPKMNPADTSDAHLHPNPGAEEVDELLSERCHLGSFIFFYSIIDCERESKTLFSWLESCACACACASARERAWLEGGRLLANTHSKTTSTHIKTASTSFRNFSGQISRNQICSFQQLCLSLFFFFLKKNACWRIETSEF